MNITSFVFVWFVSVCFIFVWFEFVFVFKGPFFGRILFGRIYKNLIIFCLIIFCLSSFMLEKNYSFTAGIQQFYLGNELTLNCQPAKMLMICSNKTILMDKLIQLVRSRFSHPRHYKYHSQFLHYQFLPLIQTMLHL